MSIRIATGSFQSPLSVEATAEHIESLIGSRRQSLASLLQRKPFVGEMNQFSFRIQRAGRLWKESPMGSFWGEIAQNGKHRSIVAYSFELDAQEFAISTIVYVLGLSLGLFMLLPSTDIVPMLFTVLFGIAPLLIYWALVKETKVIARTLEQSLSTKISVTDEV